MRTYSVILTSAATKYKLQTLVNAINPAERGLFGNITIQSDPANATVILIGGAELDATHYGISLDKGNIISFTTGDGKNDQSLLGLYAWGVTTAGMILHISLNEV